MSIDYNALLNELGLDVSDTDNFNIPNQEDHQPFIVINVSLDEGKMS